MTSAKYNRSVSVGDISSLKLNSLDDLFNTRQMKSSRTTFHLKDVEDCLKTSEGALKEEKLKYCPNIDRSVWMRSCKKEVTEPLPGKVIGQIPSWLKGTLLRNGPGCLKVGEYSFDHLFDSSALVHRFAIRNGEVTYQCRFVQTDVYKKNNAAQRIVVTDFGTKAVPDPCKSIFQRVTTMFNPGEESDNSMISVYPFGDEYYTFSESAMIHRIDPKTLETKAKVNVYEHIAIVNHTSHPHVESDGTVYNMGMSLSPRGPKYNVVCFSPSRIIIDDNGKEKKLSMFDQASIVASVPSRWLLNPSYMHSFGITENYYIIIEQPLAISLPTLISCKLRQEAMRPALKWHENEKTFIHLISRKTGSLEKTYVAEAFFYMHTINQFETRDQNYVVLDICCYRDSQMLDCLFVKAMENIHENPNYADMFRGRPLRFVLPLKYPEEKVPLQQNLITLKTVNQGLESSMDGNKPTERDTLVNDDTMNTNKYKDDYKNVLQRRATAHSLPDGNIFVKPELLCDLGCETPRFNYKLLGREYQYFYGVSSDVDLENPGTLIKVDILKKTRKIWCERKVYPSEPIFIQNPNGKTEDDGVVLSAIVWAEKESQVALLVLDGATFKEIARAVFETPSPVPKCLHGWFTLDK